jgi:phage terminase large subunit-like protein
MGAIKTVERKLADGSFKHGGRRMMAWCAGNAIVQATGTGMRIARDASGYGKVDPLMAGFDAVAEMSLNPESPVGNFPDDYEVPHWA